MHFCAGKSYRMRQFTEFERLYLHKKSFLYERASASMRLEAVFLPKRSTFFPFERSCIASFCYLFCANMASFSHLKAAVWRLFEVFLKHIDVFLQHIGVLLASLCRIFRVFSLPYLLQALKERAYRA